MNLKHLLTRKYYLLRNRLQILERSFARWFFYLLYGHHVRWLGYHKVNTTNTVDIGSPKPLPDIQDKRFSFSASFIQREITHIDEEWFYNRKTKKRLYTFSDSTRKEGRVSYRVELKSFFAHFSPRERMWVHRESPIVHFPSESQTDFLGFEPCLGNITRETVQIKTHRCDFSQCRYGFEFAYAINLSSPSTIPPEVISKSYNALKRDLTSKVPEINKILTGTDYDGELVSPRKMPLSENLICRQCGLPVFATPDRYHFECLVHGELVYARVDRVDPVKYENILRNTTEILEDLIREKCPQD